MRAGGRRPSAGVPSGVVAAQALNPPYLKEMPPVERVLTEIKGSDPLDTSARHVGALWQLLEIVDTLAGPRFSRLEFTRDEERVKAQYFAVWQRYDYNVNLPPVADRPRWYALRRQYEKDPALRNELLQRFFSAEFRAMYARATGAASGPSAIPAPAAPGSTAPPATRTATSAPAGKAPAPTGGASAPAATRPTKATDDRAAAHAEQGATYFEDRKFDLAIAEFGKAIDLNPQRVILADAFAMRGMALIEVGLYAEAVADLTEAVKLESSAENNRSLGEAYEKTLQFEKAASAYKRAIELEPCHTLTLEDLARVSIVLGRKDEAKQAYGALLKLDKETAESVLKDIEHPAGPAAVLVKEGQIAGLMIGDDALAVEYFRYALRFKPTDVRVLLDIGSGFDSAGQYDEALSVSRVLDLKPPIDKRASAHSLIGDVYVKMKRYPEALAELTESDRLHATRWNSKELGELYLTLKQYPDALAAFQRAVTLSPDFADGHFGVGKAYVAMKDFERAIPAFQEVARLEPKLARGPYELGHAYFQLRRFPEAIAALRKATGLDPKHARAHFGLGMSYRATGNKAEAMRVYETLKALDPKLAQQLLNAIDKP